jgi:ribosomal-protein-alanine N-acetyltransferase
MVGVINIRPMVEADIEAAAEIEAATYPTPWTLGIFRDELGGPGRTYLMAEVDDEPVGYAGLMMVGEEAHVTSVTVHPNRRGERIGTRLMLKVAEAALAGGARSLTLEVRVSNRAAQSLYQRFGMAPVGVRKAYYRDEDALIMWVHDIDAEEYRNRVEAIRAELL